MKDDQRGGKISIPAFLVPSQTRDPPFPVPIHPTTYLKTTQTLLIIVKWLLIYSNIHSNKYVTLN